jgi:uncharacterized protein (DUF433 family)
MDISRHLERDSETLAGGVRVRGTRLSVDFILELFEMGWTENEVRENYPQLMSEVLADVFAFLVDAVELRADTLDESVPSRLKGHSSSPATTSKPCASSCRAAAIRRFLKLRFAENEFS